MFYVVLVRVGPGAAMVATLVWSYAAMIRRQVRRARVPAILLLALGGLTARTAVGVLSGSAAMYFVQPVVTTGLMARGVRRFDRREATGGGRPGRGLLPGRRRGDVRPGVAKLFRRLTLLWAGVHLTSGAATLTLLLTLPLPSFVLYKTVLCLAITGIGVAMTTALALRTVRLEGLVPAGSGRERVAPVATFPLAPLALERAAA